MAAISVRSSIMLHINPNPILFCGTVCGFKESKFGNFAQHNSFLKLSLSDYENMLLFGPSLYFSRRCYESVNEPF